MMQRQQAQPAGTSWEESGDGSAKAEARPLLAIIEDNQDSRETLEDALTSSGYRVIGFEDARVALELLERGEKPELILLDLMTPHMDGWTFRLEQKKRAALRDIPVIAISGDSSAKAAAMDVAAYLRKPIELDRLLLTVEQVLAVSARKQLMLKGVELERLRSLGMLVASIAHEVNNPLAGVVGYLDVCARYCQRARGTPQLGDDLADKLKEAIDAAQDGTQRIAATVRLLLTFARGEDDDAPDAADAVRALEAALSLAMPQIRHRAQIVRRGGTPPPPLVKINEARLAQVFLNLLINAAHAMGNNEHDHNRIELDISFDERCVAVEITDTGSGIPPEVLSRVFDPFFSTKPAGQGTGLGLSISLEVIKSAGGSIRVHSKLGKGTTFRVEIPIAKNDPEHERAPKPRTPDHARNSGLRIVVVDDEPMMGQMLRAMLDDHQVQLFQQPELALQELEQGHVDLILCDFLMPTMTGDIFYRQLKGVRPDLISRFVLMTGASPSHTLDKLVGELQQPVLKKPFTETTLQTCLARVQRSRDVMQPQA